MRRKTFGESRDCARCSRLDAKTPKAISFPNFYAICRLTKYWKEEKNFQKENYTKIYQALTQRHWTFAGVFDRGLFECVSLPNAFATTHFIVSPLECFPFYFELELDGVVFLSCVCAEKDFHWKHWSKSRRKKEKWNFTISTCNWIDEFRRRNAERSSEWEKHWNLGAAKKNISKTGFHASKLSSALMIKVEALTGLHSHVRCKNLWHWNLDKFLLSCFCLLRLAPTWLYHCSVVVFLMLLETLEDFFVFVFHSCFFFGTSRGFCWISLEHCLSQKVAEASDDSFEIWIDWNCSNLLFL